MEYSWRTVFGSTWRTQVLRLLLLLIATVLLVGFLPGPLGNEFADLREGAVAPRDVNAPFDFEILKDPDRLAQERFDARRSVAPVVELNDTLLARLKQQFAALLSRIDAELNKPQTQLSTEQFISSLTETVNAEYGFFLPKDACSWIIDTYSQDQHAITDAFARWRRLQTALFAQGILRGETEKLGLTVTAKEGINTNRREVASFILESDLQEVLLAKLREQEPSEEAIRTGYAMLRPFLSADWISNEAETERLRVAAAAGIPSAQGIVLKGERIIERGKRIDDKQLTILNSLQTKRDEMSVARGPLGMILPKVGTALAVFLLLTLWILFLLVLRPQRMRRISDFVLGLLLVVLPLLLLTYVLLPSDWSYLYFPAGAFLMTIAILYDTEIALIATVALTGLAGLLSEGRISLVLYTALSSTTALVIVGRVSMRGHLFRATPVIFAVAVMVVSARAAFELMWSIETTFDLIAGAVAAVASPLVVFGLVFLAEKMFRVHTDLTYLELADFNRPVLRKLAFEAPGTFHHSILVGALAEAAARSIGANPILARCAAYYHDIGKLEQRDYFIENQSDQRNPHEELAPEVSADILRKHVSKGIEMARSIGLPEEIVAAIPEHHGTMVMRFFLHRAEQERGTVADSIFRYSGPRPRSKETALLMLADGCEAVSRTLKNSTPDELRQAVHQIVKDRVADGQLDHAPVSFIDLRRTETAFVKVLDGVLHKRITYPQAKAL
ncbi:MAG: HDIG domain-containing protein [bacterium]|nr:HDIG domain-containing protein [bacterium]